MDLDPKYYPASGFGFAKKPIVILQTKVEFAVDEIRALAQQPFELSENHVGYFSNGVSTGIGMMEMLAAGPRTEEELVRVCCDTTKPSRWPWRKRFRYQTPENVQELLSNLIFKRHLKDGGVIIVDHPDRAVGEPRKFVLIQIWR